MVVVGTQLWLQMESRGRPEVWGSDLDGSPSYLDGESRKDMDMDGFLPDQGGEMHNTMALTSASSSIQDELEQEVFGADLEQADTMQRETGLLQGSGAALDLPSNSSWKQDGVQALGNPRNFCDKMQVAADSIMLESSCVNVSTVIERGCNVVSTAIERGCNVCLNANAGGCNAVTTVNVGSNRVEDGGIMKESDVCSHNSCKNACVKKHLAKCAAQGAKCPNAPPAVIGKRGLACKLHGLQQETPMDTGNVKQWRSKCIGEASTCAGRVCDNAPKENEG